MWILNNLAVSAKSLKNAINKVVDSKKEVEKEEKNIKEESTATDNTLQEWQKAFQEWINKVSNTAKRVADKVTEKIEPVVNVGKLLTWDVTWYLEGKKEMEKKKEEEAKQKELINWRDIDVSTPEGAENYFMMKNFFEWEPQEEDKSWNQYYQLWYDKKKKGDIEQGLAYLKDGTAVYIQDWKRWIGERIYEVEESVMPNYWEWFMNFFPIETDIKEVVNKATKNNAGEFLRGLTEIASPLLYLKQEKKESDEEYKERMEKEITKAEEKIEKRYWSIFDWVKDSDGDSYAAKDFIRMYIKAFADSRYNSIDENGKFTMKEINDKKVWMIDQAALKSLYKTNNIHPMFWVSVMTVEDYMNANAQDERELENMEKEWLEQAVQRWDIWHIENLVGVYFDKIKLLRGSVWALIEWAIPYINGLLHQRKDDPENTEWTEATFWLLKETWVNWNASIFTALRWNLDSMNDNDKVAVDTIVKYMNLAEGNEKERLTKLINNIMRWANEDTYESTIKVLQDPELLMAKYLRDIHYTNSSASFKPGIWMVDPSKFNAHQLLIERDSICDNIDKFHHDELSTYLNILDEVSKTITDEDKETKEWLRAKVTEELWKYLWDDVTDELVNYVWMYVSEGKYLYGDNYDVTFYDFFDNFLKVEWSKNWFDDFRNLFSASIEGRKRQLKLDKLSDVVLWYDSDKTKLTNEIIAVKTNSYHDQLDNSLAIIDTFAKDPLTYAWWAIGKTAWWIAKGTTNILWKAISSSVNAQKTLRIVKAASNSANKIAELASMSWRWAHVFKSIVQYATEELVSNTTFALLQEPEYGIQDLAFDFTTSAIWWIGRWIGIIKELHKDKTMGKQELLTRWHLMYNLWKTSEEADAIITSLWVEGVVKMWNEIQEAIIDWAKKAPDILDENTVKQFFEDLSNEEWSLWNNFVKESQRQVGKLRGDLNQVALYTLWESGSKLVQKIVVWWKIKYQWVSQRWKTRQQIQQEWIQAYMKWEHRWYSKSHKDTDIERYVEINKLQSTTKKWRKIMEDKKNEEQKKLVAQKEKEADSKWWKTNKAKKQTRQKWKRWEEGKREAMIYEIYHRGRQGENFLKILETLWLDIYRLSSKAIETLWDNVNRTYATLQKFPDVEATMRDVWNDIRNLLNRGDYKWVEKILKVNWTSAFFNLALQKWDYKAICRMLWLKKGEIPKNVFDRIMKLSRLEDKKAELYRYLKRKAIKEEFWFEISGGIKSLGDLLFFKRMMKTFTGAIMWDKSYDVKYNESTKTVEVLLEWEPIYYISDDGKIKDKEGNIVQKNIILYDGSKMWSNSSSFSNIDDVIQFVKRMGKKFRDKWFYRWTRKYMVYQSIYEVLDAWWLFNDLKKTELWRAILDLYYKEISFMQPKYAEADVTYVLEEMHRVYSLAVWFDHKHPHNQLSMQEKIVIIKDVMNNYESIVDEMWKLWLDNKDITNLINYTILREYGKDILWDDKNLLRTQNVSKKLFEITQRDPNDINDYAKIVQIEQYCRKVLWLDIEETILKQPYIFKDLYSTLWKIIDNLNKDIKELETKQEENLKPIKKAKKYEWKRKKRSYTEDSLYGVDRVLWTLANEYWESYKQTTDPVLANRYLEQYKLIADSMKESKYPFDYTARIAEREFVSWAWETNVVASNRWEKENVHLEWNIFEERFHKLAKGIWFKNIVYYEVDENNHIKVIQVDNWTVNAEWKQALKALKELTNEAIDLYTIQRANWFFKDWYVFFNASHGNAAWWMLKITTIPHEWFHYSLMYMFTKDEIVKNQLLFDKTYDKHYKEIETYSETHWYFSAWLQDQWLSQDTQRIDLNEQQLINYRRYITEEWLADKFAIYATWKLDDSTLWHEVVYFFKKLWIRLCYMFNREIRNGILELFEEVEKRKDPVQDIQFNGWTKYMLPEDRKVANKLVSKNWYKKNWYQYKYELWMLWKKSITDVKDDNRELASTKEWNTLFANPSNVFWKDTIWMGEITSFKKTNINWKEDTIDNYIAQFNDKMQEDCNLITEALIDLKNNHYDDSSYTIRTGNWSIVLNKNSDWLFVYAPIQSSDINRKTKELVLQIYKDWEIDEKKFRDWAKKILFVQLEQNIFHEASSMGDYQLFVDWLYNSYKTNNFNWLNTFIRLMWNKSELVQFWNQQSLSKWTKLFKYDDPEVQAIDTLFALQQYNNTLNYMNIQWTRRWFDMWLYYIMKTYRNDILKDILKDSNKFNHILFGYDYDKNYPNYPHRLRFLIPISLNTYLAYSFHSDINWYRDFWVKLFSDIEELSDNKFADLYYTDMHPLALQNNYSFDWLNYEKDLIDKQNIIKPKSETRFSLWVTQDQISDAAVVQERLWLDKTVSEFDKVIWDEYKSIKKMVRYKFDPDRSINFLQKHFISTKWWYRDWIVENINNSDVTLHIHSTYMNEYQNREYDIIRQEWIQANKYIEILMQWSYYKIASSIKNQMDRMWINTKDVTINIAWSWLEGLKSIYNNLQERMSQASLNTFVVNILSELENIWVTVKKIISNGETWIWEAWINAAIWNGKDWEVHWSNSTMNRILWVDTWYKYKQPDEIVGNLREVGKAIWDSEKWIPAYRVPVDDNPEHHFWNPFSPSHSPWVVQLTKNIEECVIKYKNRLLGIDYKNIAQERRNFVIEQLINGKLSGKKMYYYTNKISKPWRKWDIYGVTTVDTDNPTYYDATHPNHAMVLKQIIELYDNWLLSYDPITKRLVSPSMQQLDNIKKEYANWNISNGNTKFSLAENWDDVYKTLNGVEIIRKPDEGFVMTTTFSDPFVVDALAYNWYSLQHSVWIKNDLEYDESQDYLWTNALIFSNKNKQWEFWKWMIEKMIVWWGDLWSICAWHALLKIIYDDVIQEATKRAYNWVPVLPTTTPFKDKRVIEAAKEILNEKNFEEVILSKYEKDNVDITDEVKNKLEEEFDKYKQEYIESQMYDAFSEREQELLKQKEEWTHLFIWMNEEKKEAMYKMLIERAREDLNWDESLEERKERLWQEWDEKFKEDKIIRVYKGKVYVEPKAKVVKRVRQKSDPATHVGADTSWKSFWQSTLLFALEKIFWISQPGNDHKDLFRQVWFRDLHNYFWWVDRNKIKQRIWTKENYVNYLKDMLWWMSPNKSFENIANSFYWTMSKEDNQWMFRWKLIEWDAMTSIWFPEYLNIYNEQLKLYETERYDALRQIRVWPNEKAIFSKFTSSESMLAAFMLYKLSWRISGFKIQNQKQMPLSISKDYYNRFPKPLYYTNTKFTDEEYQNNKKEWHIMVDIEWKSESEEAKLYWLFFRWIKDIILDDVFKITDANWLVDLDSVVQQCIAKFDQYNVEWNPVVWKLYKDFKKLDPLKQQEFILPFFIKRMEFENNPYIEWWWYTLDMEDVKFFVSDDTNLVRDWTRKMMDAWYDVHDLTHIQWDISQRFEELNKWVDSKFIINWQQAKQTPRMKFSLSENWDDNYNIVTDTNNQIKHLWELMYPWIKWDVYYISNTIINKPVTIFNLTKDEFKKYESLLPKNVKVIDNKDEIFNEITNWSDSICFVWKKWNKLNDLDLLHIEKDITDPVTIKSNNTTLIETLKQRNQILKENWIKYPKTDKKLLEQNHSRDWIAKQIEILNETNKRILDIRNTKVEIDALRETMKNVIKRPIYSYANNIIQELWQEKIKNTIDEWIRKHNNQNLLINEWIEKPINLENNSFWDIPPIGILDKRYWDISQMQSVAPQIEKDLIKTYWNFEIVPYTVESNLNKINNKWNFVLRCNDWYTFWKTNNEIKRLYPEYTMVYQRNDSNIMYYKRDENVLKRDVDLEKKAAVDLNEEATKHIECCII